MSEERPRHYLFEMIAFSFLWLGSMLAIGIFLVSIDLLAAGMWAAWTLTLGAIVMEWTLYRVYYVATGCGASEEPSEANGLTGIGVLDEETGAVYLLGGPDTDPDAKEGQRRS